MTTTANNIINAVKASDNILICGHIRPDGDCMGASLAMKRICEKLGKNADAVCDDERPAAYSFLSGYDRYNCRTSNKYDLFIAVDCGDEKRLGDYRRFLSVNHSIDIDHHPTNTGYAEINYVDPTAASCCLIIFELFEDSGLIDKEVAEMLYTGISTDTGHFMHSNTDARVFEAAKKLCSFGIDIAQLNHAIYGNVSINKTKLTARALGGIELFENGRIAVMKITSEDLGACNCRTQDTEGLINNLTCISGVEISISVCEQSDGPYRVSFRAHNSDVATAAAKFGGGGHKLASGCVIYGKNIDEVARSAVDAARSAL